MKQGYVYIMASQRNGTLYVGVTSDLARRVMEHKGSAVPGFTQNYSCHLLVWYQACDDIMIAIAEEKKLKKWLREWKLNLIERTNPEWNDLSFDLF